MREGCSLCVNRVFDCANMPDRTAITHKITKSHRGPNSASSSMIPFRTLRASAPILRRTQVASSLVPHLIEAIHPLLSLQSLDPRHPRTQKQDLPPGVPLGPHSRHKTRVRRRDCPSYRQRCQISLLTSFQTLWRDQNPACTK
jgi:hypothetical protein